MKRSILIFLLVMMAPVFAQLTPYDLAVSGHITSDQHWTSDNVYLLDGIVYIDSLVTVTIDPGTLILGKKADAANAGSLVVLRGGRLVAQGTKDAPIVFTSQQPVGLRSRGDWGGIILLGCANNNQSQQVQIEGIESGAVHGGTNDADDSGILSYVRIEFPGIALSTDNEINGLTMGSIGSGTQIDHIQVSYSGDDSYEFFGGAVNPRYLIAYNAIDDDFDTDFGFSGKVQYGFTIRDPRTADISKSEAFESDNDGSGSANSPRTSAAFSNMTAIGPKEVASQVSGTDYSDLFYYGVHQRRRTRLNIYNSVFAGWDEGGVHVDGSKENSGDVGDDLANGVSNFKHNIVAGNSVTMDAVYGSGSSILVPSTYFSANNSSLTEPSDLMLTDPYNRLNPNLVPATGSPCLSGADFTGLTGFDVVTYRGAFGSNNSNRWDEGWANYDPQGTVYNNSAIDWTASIRIEDAARYSREVIIGRASGATNGVDASLGEAELPPVGFDLDARLTLPSTQTVAMDLRVSDLTTSTITWTLNIANNASGNMKISWDPSKLVGDFTLQDAASHGSLLSLDMNSTSSVSTGYTALEIVCNAHFTAGLTVGDSWNLLSFPGLNQTGSQAPSTLYTSRDVAANVFKYTSGGYVAVTSMTPALPVWLKHSGPKTYNWTGATALAHAERAPFDMFAGWNLIGVYDYIISTSDIVTYPGNQLTGLIYGYTPGSGYSPAGSLMPGQGYWAKASTACQLALPNVSLLPKESEMQVIKSEWGKLIISDAKGSSYTLYVAQNADGLDYYELPPAPPAGAFDIRFDSQRFVEELSTVKGIELNGVQYPVSVRAEGISVELENIGIINDGEVIKVNSAEGNKIYASSEFSSAKVNSYELAQNFPNPFNPSTKIQFSIPEAGNVSLTVFNALGQKVAELVNGNMSKGNHTVNFDASSLTSGMYFYKIQSGSFSATKKMMLIK